MRFLKRSVSWLLALSLLLSLTLTLSGCGKQEPGEEPDNEQTGDEEQTVDRIGTVPLDQCVIVLPTTPTAAETRTAGMLQKQLAGSKGISLSTCTAGSDAANAAAGKIVIGAALCTKAQPDGDNGFDIVGNGNTLEIAANSSYGYEAALSYLTRNIFYKGTVAVNDQTARSGNGNSLLTARVDHLGEVRFMVNNVYGYGSTKPMRQRMNMLIDLYKTYSPDVIGLQEYHDDPRRFMTPLLTAAGYAEARPGGTTNGGSTPLYYKTDVLELLDCGYLLYNAAPDLRSSAYQSMLGSYTMAQVVYDDYSKSITWGIFRVRETGHIFLAASTHLFYMRNTSVSGDARDSIWRQVQAAIAKETVLSAADAYLATQGLEAGTMPILIGGDMNDVVSSPMYSIMQGASPSSSGNYTGNNKMANTNTLLPEQDRIRYSTNHHHEGNWNQTYQIFDEPYVKARSEAYANSLDYIFVDSNAVVDHRIEIKYTAALFDLFAMLATDHCPVLLDFNLGA